MFSMKLVTVLHLLFAFVVLPGRGEVGTCRYDEDYCSCKFGAANEGTCWDRVAGTATAGECLSRFCKAGWTCSCAGRTHLCPKRDAVKHVVDGSIGGSPNTACHEETHKVAGKGILELGSWTPRISRSGLLANACTRIAWWLNGDLMGNYGDDPVIDATNVDSEVLRRADHTLYELKSGDLIAFRYKTASYYCFNSQVILNVNGTVLDSATGAMSITFARQHTPDWFMPSFTPVFSPSESGATPTDFSPLRTNFLSSGLPITPGVDHWEAPDGSRDHALSNFYYRIQIP